MKEITIKCEGFLTPTEPTGAAEMFFTMDFKYILDSGNPSMCKIKENCELNGVKLNEDTLFNWFWFRNDQSIDFALFGVKEGNSVIFPAGMSGLSRKFPSEIFKDKKEGDVVLLKQYARIHDSEYKGDPYDDEGEIAKVTLECTLKQRDSEFNYESFEALYSDLLKYHELSQKIRKLREIDRYRH